jgi:hypothetical protein
MLAYQKSLFVFFCPLFSQRMFHLDGLGFVDGFAPFPLCCTYSDGITPLGS